MWTSRGQWNRRLKVLVLFLLIAALVETGKQCYGQSVGVSIGTYNRGAGGHPAFFTNLQARVGLFGAVVEFDHVPTVNTITGFPVDLFSLSLGADLRVGPGFVPLRAGWSRWRDWVNPAKDFEMYDGLRVQAGYGVRAGLLRVEARGSYTRYGGPDAVLLIGVEIG